MISSGPGRRDCHRGHINAGMALWMACVVHTRSAREHESENGFQLMRIGTEVMLKEYVSVQVGLFQ